MPDACRTRDQRVDNAGQGEGKGRERKGTIADDEHPREQSAPADKQQRERNPIWDTVCDVCGVDSGALTKTISTLIGRAVKEIKEASPDVTPDMIRRKAAAYRKQYPDCALTVSALMKHWSTLLVVTVNPVAASKPIPTLDEQAAPFKGKTMADLIQQVEMEMGTVTTTEEAL